MIVTLPDGSTRQFDQPTSVAEVAASIGAGLAKAALAGEVDGRLVDTSFVMEQDANLKIITAKDPEGLEVIRHSTAHLLAHAVQDLFANVQVTIGPVIEDGFYYDFSFARAFTPEDLARIEERMTELASANLPVQREELTRDEAIGLFAQLGQDYKVDIIRDIPGNETLSVYRQGDFVDLCRGPHVPSTSCLKAFKLTKVAGAYWRGDSNNEMLQRIYGTAWPDKKQLEAYLFRLEEAKRRDHREIGKKLELFHFQDIAPGMAFWHPKGWLINSILRNFIREVQLKSGYQEISTPILVDHVLWEKSGHAAKFKDQMFNTESESQPYAIKPMNCPCHVQVYNQGVKSYRDLPIRFAEFGCCHRNEPSGSLHGLMRVREFTQDDGHIFCREDQIQHETSRFIDQLFYVYRKLGFTSIQVKLSTRPDERVGEEEAWDRAEAALAAALDAKGLDWQLLPGEGAFYGPKIEFSLQDCLGRIWQCGTIQLDFSMPTRLEAQYVAEDNSKHRPVMLHRAILGSVERLIGILLEHYADELPLWMAPVQVVVANISEAHAAYAQSVSDQLKQLGVRVECDLRNEKLGYKIREHTIQRVPYIVVVGGQEVEQQTLTVRPRQGEQQQGLKFEQFFALISQNLKLSAEDLPLEPNDQCGAASSKAAERE